MQIVHGFPPRESAGTEIYTLRLCEGMAKRGWEVHVIASTRAPGKQHCSVLPKEEFEWGTVTRIVNNLPWRPMAQGERDPVIEILLEKFEDEIKPDIIHIQHLLFLSTGVNWRAPTVATLHDAWGWCARGGSLFYKGAACVGPKFSRCADCYSEFRSGTDIEHALGVAAGKVSSVVPTEMLHGLWRKLPSSIRAITRQGGTKKCSEESFNLRQENTATAFRKCDVIVSPSMWLKREAELHKLGEVVHIPHGVDMVPGKKCSADDFFIFLGSIAPHKGPSLVANAWLSAKEEVADGEELPRLRIVGPIVDADYAKSIPNDLIEPALTPEEVPQILRDARALIVGSKWPENSPLVILEALAAGCPVIAPRIGGIPELLKDGIDGILYEAGDLTSLKLAIIQMTKTNYSPEVPPTFSAHTSEIEGLYRSVLESRP
jgi:glycosyltransferase involved in cell wall biosynthesis